VRGEKGESLAVERSGPRRGRWRDFASGEGGDLLDLIAETACCGDLKKAFRWGCDWLGLERPAPGSARACPRESGGAARGQALPARRKAASAAKEEERLGAAAAREAAEKRARALEIWQDARPLQTGDPVDRYLRNRGIDLAAALGRAPAALRYAPDLRYETGRRFGAMVAPITGGAGEFLAIHRTFLEARPDGTVVKAPVPAPKKVLGGFAGGSIKLWRGRSGKPWLHMPMRSTIVVGEGIEDALAALAGAEISFPAAPGRAAAAPVPISALRVVSAVALGNLATLALPCQVSRLVILQQRDAPGSEAAKALATAVARLEAQAIEVLLLQLPAWSGVKDVADMMRLLRVARAA
jgi:hypothetical protein